MKKQVLLLLLSFMLSVFVGCDNGLYSNAPLIEKGQGDKFKNPEGYWKMAEPNKEDDPLLLYVEDISTGLFLKDHEYTLKILDNDGTFTDDHLFIRVKKNRPTYVIQIEAREEKPDKKDEFIYSFLIKEENQYYWFPTYENNLNPDVVNVLSAILINAKNRNSIRLSDEFINNKGSQLLKALLKSRPKTDLSNTFYQLNKITLAEAKTIIDKVRAEKKKKQKK